MWGQGVPNKQTPRIQRLKIMGEFQLIMDYVSASIPKKVSKQKTIKSIQSCKTVSQKGKKGKDGVLPSSPSNYFSVHLNPDVQYDKLVRSSEYDASSHKIENQKQSQRLTKNDYHHKDPSEPIHKQTNNMPSPEYYMSPPENKKTRSSRSNSRQTITHSNRLLQNLKKQHDNQTKKFSPSVSEKEMYRLHKIHLLEKKQLIKKLGKSRESRRMKESKEKK